MFCFVAQRNWSTTLPWWNVEHLEQTTLKFLYCFKIHRIHEALDYVSPAQFEATHPDSSELESLLAL